MSKKQDVNNNEENVKTVTPDSKELNQVLDINSVDTSELKTLSDTELIQQTKNLVRSERKITHIILNHIREIESRKAYAAMGFESMFAFLVKGLHYSESAAYRRLQSARLLNKLPELSQKIETGSINLSQLTQVQKCLKASKKAGIVVTRKKVKDVLGNLENKSGFETQKVLSQEFNLPVQSQEVTKPQQDDSVRLELTFSKEDYEILVQAKNMLSHACPENTWNQVFVHLAKTEIRKRSGAKPPRSTQRLSGAEVKKKYRPYISVHTKRELLEKLKLECSFVDPITNRKCNSKYQLQTDHKIPLYRGGSNEPSNLRMLCRTHNLHEAKKWGL